METTLEAPGKAKHIRLELPPDVHRLLRVLSAYHGATMAEHAITALRSALSAEAEERGIKL